jgi:tRNA wybutosine-synthesizing protein 1
MTKPEEYAKLIKAAEPQFLELKAYMAVGFSRERLGMKFMPLHDEIANFAKQIQEHTDYKIIDEKKNSRVILMMQEEKNRFIKLS